MNREQRIKQAKAKLSALEIPYLAIKRQYDDAKRALTQAENMYDIGERVSVTETCRRGCCVENEYTGVVIGKEKNGAWRVKSDDGHVYEYVSEYDMKRLSK